MTLHAKCGVNTDSESCMASAIHWKMVKKANHKEVKVEKDHKLNWKYK